MKLQKKYY